MNFLEENFPSLLNLKYNVSLITYLEMKETKLILLDADKRKMKKDLPAWNFPSSPLSTKKEKGKRMEIYEGKRNIQKIFSLFISFGGGKQSG